MEIPHLQQMTYDHTYPLFLLLTNARSAPSALNLLTSFKRPFFQVSFSSSVWIECWRTVMFLRTIFVGALTLTIVFWVNAYYFLMVMSPLCVPYTHKKMRWWQQDLPKTCSLYLKHRSLKLVKCLNYCLAGLGHNQVPYECLGKGRGEGLKMPNHQKQCLFFNQEVVPNCPNQNLI